MQPLVIDSPTVITDVHGTPLLWYLPGLLTKDRREEVWGAAHLIEGKLELQGTSKNWRVGPQFYKKPEDCERPPGTLSLAPAWLLQGHDVSISVHSGTRPRTQEMLNGLQSPAWNLEISAAMKHPTEDDPIRRWFNQTRVLSAILAGALSIIHPELYSLGQQAMLVLGERPEHFVPDADPDRLHTLLKEWVHPWTATSIMVNRSTPVHRDVHGRNSWMDMMVTLGEYSPCYLDVPGLGAKLRYDPGTAVGLLSKVVRHGVAEVAGDRMCIAYYMRDKVHDRLGVRAGGWMNLSEYDRIRCANSDPGADSGSPITDDS
jgi:hypothetical protein